MSKTVKLGIGLASFFIPVAILLLWGVATHKEAGLMPVCWPAEGEGYAVYNQACEHTIKWPKIPLLVRIDLADDTLVYTSAIEGAMKLWNSQVGPLFIKVHAGAADVIVQWGPTAMDNSAGYTQHIGAKEGVRQAVITFTDPNDLHMMYRFAVHEFGHVLGLAHDDFTSSIMYPVQPAVNDKISFVLPTDADIKLLKKLYF